RITEEQGRVDEVRLGRLGGVPSRCDHELVRRSPGRRGNDGDVTSECDLEAIVVQHLTDTALALLEPWQLLLHGRRRLAQPEELRVAVRKARGCYTGLVERAGDVRDLLGLRRLPARVQG